MSEIQELDRKSSFIFVGDLNAHHQEWLKSVSPTDRHGNAAFDFANLSGCSQLIKEPTHKLDNCLDLLLTDVLGVVDSVVDLSLGNSDHSSNSFSVKVGFKITNITFSRKVYQKSHINWPCFGGDLCNSSLPPIRTDDGSVTYDPSKKAEVFSTVFRINRVIRYSS